MNPKKPLGRKNYGHIPHLPGSRMGPGDHSCPEGQARIATLKARDRHDDIIVQEKLDGSNVGVARLGDNIYPLGRAGYLASTSPFEQHRFFSNWAYENFHRFMAVLEDGERLAGEWLMQAHGTKYKLIHEPFVAFDILVESTRMPFDEFSSRVEKGDFVTPALLHRGEPFSIENAMKKLDTYGFHGAQEPVEGAVWRVERERLIDRRKGGPRRRVVDFLVKHVRSDKVDGKYLDEDIWNEGARRYML
ncbi:MAG: hypothetical protein MAG431_00470 [Chloroflexi bacterium]|nr:hypothetical protein [Chloroflexota bacterium]